MSYLIDFIFDFETRSRTDLNKSGTVKYVQDPSTEATLITWCFGRTGPLKAWRKGQPVPQELIHVAQNPHLYKFVAQNVGFDYMIWMHIFWKLILGAPQPIAVENIDDLMALSSHHRTGASLDSIAQMLGLPYSKDKEGRTLMLKQCKPNSKGQFVELTPEEWVKFERYGLMDTRILREAYYRLPPLPAAERWAWEWTFKRNLRGIGVDMPLVHELSDIVQSAMPGLVAEFNYLTGYKATMGSPITCLAFFKQFYPGIQNMQKETVRDMLMADHYVPPHVKRALEIKALAGSTSIAKIPLALKLASNNRIYEVLAYHFAQTKRWAGRGIQIQNFPRVDDKRADPLDFDMNTRHLAEHIKVMRPKLKDPIGFAKNMLRRIWIAAPGNTFYCGDFSKVEPSVLFWLMNLGPIPKKWYEEMAVEIYGKPIDQIGKESEERQVGKTAALSCGYGAGWKSFRKKTYKDTGILLTEEMSKIVIEAYRRKYKVVTKFWKDLEDGFRLAVHGQTSSICEGRIFIMPMEHPWKGVQIRLPSGSYLYYHQATEKFEQWYQNEEDKRLSVKDWELLPVHEKKNWKFVARNVLKYLADQGSGRIAYDYVYGGLLCENVVSAIARDIMVPAMWRLDNAGFDVLGCVHDELWGESYPGREKEFTSLMCVNPSWCDMKIEADLKAGDRYLK